jgi:Ca-activated chloride channel family protein
MAPYRVVDAFGREFLQSQPVRLDEAMLTSLAEATDGRYFNAKNTAALEQVYASIDALEKTEIEGRIFTEYREVFSWPMCTGLGCMLVTIVLGSTWLRGLPS